MALSFTQKLKLQGLINVAIKVCCGHLTAAVLSQNFSKTVKSFIVNGMAYHFMSIIKGTPDYWKHFLLDFLALVKEFGLLTFFMILGYADLRLNELISIIAKLQGKICWKKVFTTWTISSVAVILR